LEFLTVELDHAGVRQCRDVAVPNKQVMCAACRSKFRQVPERVSAMVACVAWSALSARPNEMAE
jgi:hypothetical protein